MKNLEQLTEEEALRYQEILARLAGTKAKERLIDYITFLFASFQVPNTIINQLAGLERLSENEMRKLYGRLCMIELENRSVGAPDYFDLVTEIFKPFL